MSTEPTQTLPALNVWRDHDGSPDCPLPVGTVVDTRTYLGTRRWKKPAEDIGWRRVTCYRVHSYPKEST